MADFSEYSIVTYQRKPGCWRAAISLKDHTRIVANASVLSLVTPDDYASEAEAQRAAELLIGKLRKRDR
jgi:hypothetical protein